MELVAIKTGQLPSLFGLDAKVDLYKQGGPYSKDCQIKADNDLEAINCWLNSYKDNKHTLLAYEREAKRLLLWCIYEKGKPLTELKITDLEDYFTFLKNPPSAWCTNKRKAKQGQGWRPFIGPLNRAAFSMATRVINSLLNYLVAADYLRTNPVKLIRNKNSFNLNLVEYKYRVWERMLEEDEWRVVQATLDNMPESTKKEIDNKLRTQFLFALLYMLGLRIHEVEKSSWNAFRKVDGEWWFFIKGKGGKPGHIPVNEQLLHFVKIYRLHLGKTPSPDIEETENLFISKKTKQPLQQRQLYALVKAIGQKAAASFIDKPRKARKLEKLSPHWLRHLSASHQDKLGIPATVIQANHRHSSAQTTQIYLHAEDKVRMKEMQKMTMAIQLKVSELEKSSNFTEMAVIVKADAVTEELNFLKLLDAIEMHVLRGIKWELKNQTRELLVDQFKKSYIYKRAFSLCYKLQGVDEAQVNNIKKVIIREAEIRLFSCEIRVNNYEKK